MSSGFVSGGTTDKPIERDNEWLKAQQEIEANRRRKEEESRQQGGKTLFDVLQSNKAAKQEAFEESIKLKNQFRNLDEDEIEFLDSVLESTRAKEEAVKKETTEQLNLFRRQQEEADKALLEETEEAATEGNETGKARSPTAGESHWTINARKRKRAKEKEILKGVKLRKSSTNERPVELVAAKSEGALNKPEEKGAHAATKVKEKETAEKKASSLAPRDIATANTSPSQDIKDSPKPGGTLGLSLAGYSSDEED